MPEKLETLIDRVHRELTDEDIAKIAGTYHAWRGDKGAREYADVPGFCKAAKLEEFVSRVMCLRPGVMSVPEQLRTMANLSRRK
jgi:type I restriction enzyme M protein